MVGWLQLSRTRFKQNSRSYEQQTSYIGRTSSLVSRTDSPLREVSSEHRVEMIYQSSGFYRKSDKFGWYLVGRLRKVIGLALEIDGRLMASSNGII